MLFFLVLPFFFLISCSSDAEIVQKATGENFELLHSGSYSVVDSAGMERVGTLTNIYMNVEFGDGENAALFTRIFFLDQSRGYLKNTFPSEVALRCTIRISGSGKILGYESYEKIVKNLKIPELYKRELLASANPKDFADLQRREWTMAHLLEGTFPQRQNITDRLKQEGCLAKLDISVDSVVTGSWQKVEDRRCFEYSIFYSEKLPWNKLLLEQYLHTAVDSLRLRPFAFDSATAKVKSSFLVEPANGVPCRITKTSRQLNFIHHRETGKKEQFESIYYGENLFSRPKVGSE